jgi:hypothetical protein
MIASVHLADIGARSSLARLPSTRRLARVSGLRWCTVAWSARLSGDLRPRPDPRRLGLVAFWEDEDALDQFVATDPLVSDLAGGWSVRLDPLRASGSWPGLPGDLPASRSVPHDGPVAALTLGRLRISQGWRFLRASARAEAEVLDAPGLLWATGFGRPPIVATFSLWNDSRSLSTYAYGRADPAHLDAVAEGERKPFHRQSAFVRFRPYASKGALAAPNPLAEQWLSDATATSASLEAPDG